MARRLRVLSLGAGVQSTTLALMAAHGEIDAPDCAIFADTQAEPREVYAHLDWLRSPNVLPFAVHVVTAGSLRQELLDAAAGLRGAWGRPPVFLRNRGTGRARLAWEDLPLAGGDAPALPPPRRRAAGKVRRQCTGDYKIDPIRQKIRQLLGVRPGRRVPAGFAAVSLIGISLDEVERVKQPAEAWLSNEHPLVDLRMTRWDCEQWLRRHEYPVPPKSACTFCPLRSNAGWRQLRDEMPEAWADACAVDAAIREGIAGIAGAPVYLHRDLVPLSEVDLSTAADAQVRELFGAECEGLCGV